MATNETNIKATSRELSGKDIYRLCGDMGRQSMKDIIGSTISIEAWAIYDDLDKDDNEVEVLSILTPEGEAFTTTSKTFIREFNKMRKWIPDLDMIEIQEGSSKNGRSFIYCRLPNDR